MLCMFRNRRMLDKKLIDQEVELYFASIGVQMVRLD